MRIIFSLCLLIFLQLQANAQLKIGLKISPQLSWASPDNKNTTSNGTRINASYGLMVDYYFTENYAFASEFCVNSIGANLNVSKDKYHHVEKGTNSYTNTEDIIYDYKLQYFQVPLLLKMRTKETGAMRYYAEFGFGMGFLFKSKADVEFGSESLSNVNINDPDPEDAYYIFKDVSNLYSDDVSSFRGSLIIGAGLQYSLQSNSAIVLGLRYDNGLSSFTADEKWSTSLNFLALNFGLLF